MAQLKFEATADASNALRGFQQIQDKVAETAKGVEKSGMSIEQMFNKVKTAANIAIAGISLKSLTDQIVQTRGEFQQLEVAFQTMLGSQQKASTLMNQLVKTAATTPFDLKGVANGAKQLLAYGTSADEVNSKLIKLGNIAAGLSLNLNDLVWLYGTTMTQGRMFTMDLRQFMSRGIPMSEAIADVLGTTKDKVADLVSQGKVTSDVVTKAIDAMSTGTGKFAGLMDAQSKTITGQIANIQDAFDMMLNDIGKDQEGVINAALRGASWLIENYESVGRVVLTAAAAWGEYKASLMLATAAENIKAKNKNVIENERQDSLKNIISNFSDESSNAGDVAGTQASTAATNADTAARQANKTAIDEQIAALQASLAAKVAEAQANDDEAQSALKTAQNTKEYTEDLVERSRAALQAALESGNGEEQHTAQIKLKDAVEKDNIATERLREAQTKAGTTATALQTAKEKENAFATQVDTANKKANTAATGLWATATRAATTALNSMKTALATNPFTAILMGITTIIGLLPLFTSETEEATGAQKQLRDAISDEQGKLMGYMAILENTDKSTKLYKDTVSDFNTLAKQYNSTQIDVNSTLAEQEAAYKALTKAIKEQATAKILSQATEDAMKNASDTEKKAMKDLEDDAKSFSYTTNEVAGTTSAGVAMSVTKAASSIQNITGDMWGSISAEVMSKSQEMAKAFNESPEAAEQFVAQEQTIIENMLRSMGANDEDIKAFGGTIKDYLNDVGEGFADNYGELERTQKQLGGLQQSTVDLGDITEENIKTYSYEQLQKAAEKVNDKINDISNNTASPKVDDTQLQDLKKLLQEINDLMPTMLTQGSNKDLADRIKQAKAARDSAVYGSKEYNEANAQVATLLAEQKRRSSGLAENQDKNAKKNASDKKKQDKAENDEAARRQRLAKEEEKWDEQTARQHQEALFAQREADIATIKDTGEREREERALQHDKDLYQLEQQALSFRKANYEHNKAVFENSAKGNKNKYKGTVQGTALTADQQAQLDAQRERIETEWQQYTEELVRNNEKELNDYLMQYGSMEAQKLAITEDYERQIREIRESNDSEEVKNMKIGNLQRQEQQKQAELANNSLQQQIDWYSVFDNMGLVMNSVLEPVLKQLSNFTQTSNFNKLGADQQAAIIDAMNNMRQQIGSTGDENWHDLARAMTEYQQSLQQMQAANEAYTRKEAELAPKIQLAESIVTGLVNSKNADPKALKKAQNDLADLRAQLNSAGLAVDDAKNNVSGASKKLSSTANNVMKPVSKIYTFLNSAGLQQIAELWGAFEQLEGAINGLKALKEAGKAAEGLKEGSQNIADAGKDAAGAVQNGGEAVKKALGSIGDELGNGGFIAQIIAAILKILDILKDGIGPIISSLLDTILGAISGIIQNILSGKFVQQIATSLWNGIRGIVDAVIGRLGHILSFGALGSSISDWFTNSNAKEVEDTINTLTEENKVLEQSIDDLKDTIENTNGVGAIKASQQAIDLQEKANENYKKIAEAQAGYHGHHHSWDYYWSGFTNDEIDNLNSQFFVNGLDSNWTGELFDLSPEQMKVLRENADIWQRILDTGKGGYGDRLGEKLDDYIDQAGKLEEITDQLYETLTTTTKDNVFDDFLNSLYDMAAGSDEVFDDIADNWQEMVNKMVINNLVGAKFQKQLESWYETLAKLNERRTNGEISDAQYKAELDALYKQYQGYVQSAQSDIANFKSMGIIQETEQDEQNASANGVSSITYDQANTFIGLVTAGNIVTQQISDNMVKAIASLTAMTGFTSSANATILEIRNLMIYNNSYLEDVVKYTKAMYSDFSDKIDQTNKYLKEMK